MSKGETQTPGPWKCDGKEIGGQLAVTSGTVLVCDADTADAKRIVLCVNSCEGIKDPRALRAVLNASMDVVAALANCKMPPPLRDAEAALSAALRKLTQG